MFVCLFVFYQILSVVFLTITYSHSVNSPKLRFSCSRWCLHKLRSCEFRFLKYPLKAAQVRQLSVIAKAGWWSSCCARECVRGHGYSWRLPLKPITLQCCRDTEALPRATKLLPQPHSCDFPFLRAMSKTLKKKKNHWTNKVHESVLCRNEEGELGLELKGGAENGQFPVIGELLPGGAVCHSGKLFQDELLLEVNDTPVAGLTTRDVHAVVKHSKDPLRLKCVKQGEVCKLSAQLSRMSQFFFRFFFENR